MTNIAFIGLGNMGGPMARNLLKALHGVCAFDLSAAALKTATDAGATAAKTANEAIAGADVIVTCCPAGSMCARSTLRMVCWCMRRKAHC